MMGVGVSKMKRCVERYGYNISMEKIDARKLTPREITEQYKI
jgi:hypothetical protein